MCLECFGGPGRGPPGHHPGPGGPPGGPGGWGPPGGPGGRGGSFGNPLLDCLCCPCGILCYFCYAFQEIGNCFCGLGNCFGYERRPPGGPGYGPPHHHRY